MTASLAPSRNCPWHAGEVQMQTSVGVAERKLSVGQQVTRTYMPDKHRTLFEEQPFVVLGSFDANGDVWATLIASTPGFMQSPTKRFIAQTIWSTDDAGLALR
jgi:predicted pyridoxine 5'-phosphate oxidase superfamily flavin-nucleotide-binding protein